MGRWDVGTLGHFVSFLNMVDSLQALFFTFVYLYWIGWLPRLSTVDYFHWRGWLFPKNVDFRRGYSFFSSVLPSLPSNLHDFATQSRQVINENEDENDDEDDDDDENDPYMSKIPL